jgi:hypothetical protein
MGHVRSTDFRREREGMTGSLKRGSPSRSVNLTIHREIGRPGKPSGDPTSRQSNCQAQMTQTSILKHVGYGGLAGEELTKSSALDHQNRPSEIFLINSDIFKD